MFHRISALLPLLVCAALLLAACGGAPATALSPRSPPL